jgi:hypothetical protein
VCRALPGMEIRADPGFATEATVWLGAGSKADAGATLLMETGAVGVEACTESGAGAEADAGGAVPLSRPTC